MCGIKRFIIWFISVIAVSFICMASASGEGAATGQTAKLSVEPGYSLFHFDQPGLDVKGWDNDGCTFFFLPSYINIKKIDQSGSALKICSEDGSEIIEPALNQIQDVLVMNTSDGSVTPWKLGVFQSENLYTVDISLDGSEYYDIDHYDYTGASIDVRSTSGRLTYHEGKALIKGRGNSSWLPDPKYHKEPYQLKLPDKMPLCGMKSADKWVLIKNDPTQMRNKMTYDLAADMRMEYAIESDWVDVYINGDYMGNYLLCHEPDIGSGDLDIGSLSAFNRFYMNGAEVIETDDIKGYDYSTGDPVPEGGYLIEKNAAGRYENKKCGFRSGDDFFTMKSPDNASLDEVRYIRDFVNEVDNGIHDGIWPGMADEYSFARQYLIAELSLNPDGGFTSWFFYKKPDGEMLFAGPCWDFDGAYGRWTDPVYKDYTGSIFDIQDHVSSDTGDTALDWDRVMLGNEEYRDYVASVFCEYIPVYDKLLSEGLDGYYERVYCSSCMDQIRWEGYEDYAFVIRSAYKHLAFFLYKRLESMADGYGQNVSLHEPDIYDDTSHLLTFIYPDGDTKEMTVPDGKQLSPEDMPDYNDSQYAGWRSDDQYLSLYSYYDPIFEDRTFVLADYGS